MSKRIKSPTSDNIHTVLVSGDWHGNRDWAEHVLVEAARNDAQLVVVVGDHGVVWPGRTFSDQLSAHARTWDVQVVLVPGNHDAHPDLDALPRDEHGLAKIAPRIWHASRPSRWQIRGVQFAALGGAHSIDAEMRTPGLSWWPDELVTPEMIDALGTDPVDVLFTHEAPTRDHLRAVMTLAPHIAAISDAQRELVRAAVENTKPKAVFHGHWHQRRDGNLALADGSSVPVHCLDRQDTAGNWVLLDVDSLEVRDPRKRRNPAA